MAQAPDNPPEPSRPWWITSLIAAAVAMVVAAFAMWLPFWRGTILLLVGCLAFLYVLRRNPALWHRRMAAASFGAAISSGIVPNIDIGVTLGPAQFGTLVSQNGPALPILFGILTAVFAILDYLGRRPAPAAPGGTSQRTTVLTKGSGSHAAGRDQVVQAPHSTYIENKGAVDAETLNKIVGRYEQHIGDRDQRLRGAEDALAKQDQTIEQLRAALDRAGTKAAAGDPAARAAIDEAHKSGDVARLQAVLIAEADRQEKLVRDSAADYLALCREIAVVAFLRGDIDEARERLHAVLRLVPDDLDATTRLGHVHRLRGEWAEAEHSYRKVLQFAPTDMNTLAVAYLNLGIVLRKRGDLDGAEGMHRKALQIEEKLGRPTGMADTYGNLGIVLDKRGDLDGAEAMHRKALEINKKLGRPEGMACNYGNLGLLLETRGDLDGAEAMHRKSLEIEEKLGRPLGMASDYGNLGIVLKKRGDLDGAEAMYRKALQINEKLGRPEGMAIQYGNLGGVFEKRGDLDGAEAMYRKALEINEKLGRPEGMADTYANLGRVLENRGHLDGARELWTKARDLFQKIGMPHMVEKVQGWLDELEDSKQA